MLNRRLVLSALALAATVLSTSAARADIEIDPFTQPDPRVQYAIGPDANPFVQVTDLGGLTRTVTLTVTSAVGTNSLVGQIGGGLFSASFDVASSGTASIVYAYTSAQNFNPNNFPGFLTFVAAGDNGFAADIPLAITITTTTGNLTFNGSLPLTNTLQDVPIALSSFTGTGDLTQVTGLSINITGGQASDFILNALTIRTPDQPPPAVPAPPAAFLALAALPAFGAWRMAKARKAVVA